MRGLDYQDQVRFGYVEPDDDDDLPRCPECGTILSHEPTDVYIQAEFPDDPDLLYECPDCHQVWSAEDVYA